MKKLLDFPEIIIKKVEDTMAREGHKNFTSAVIAIISGYYDRKYISKHKEKTEKRVIVDPVDNMTDEQYCEYKGGKVMKQNALPVCARPLNADGSMVSYIPLEKVKSMWKD